MQILVLVACRAFQLLVGKVFCISHDGVCNDGVLKVRPLDIRVVEVHSVQTLAGKIPPNNVKVGEIYAA